MFPPRLCHFSVLWGRFVWQCADIYYFAQDYWVILMSMVCGEDLFVSVTRTFPRVIYLLPMSISVRTYIGFGQHCAYHDIEFYLLDLAIAC